MRIKSCQIAQWCKKQTTPFCLNCAFWTLSVPLPSCTSAWAVKKSKNCCSRLSWTFRWTHKLLCVPPAWVQSMASRCVALGFNVPVSFNDSPALLCKLLRYFHALCYLSWCLNCISSAIFKKDMLPARSYPTTFLFSRGEAGTGDTWLIHCLHFFQTTLQTSVLSFFCTCTIFPKTAQ